MKILRVLSDSNGDPKAVDLRFEIGEVYDIGLLMADNEEIKKMLNELRKDFDDHHESKTASHISIYHDHYTP